MKFTAQEEYGLRCILYLARRAQETGNAGGAAENATGDSVAVRVADIAANEGLSEQYVGKLFRVLAKAGLVKSVRGRHGGFRLARPAAAIPVAETLAALGGKIYEPNTCDRYKGNRRFCVHTNDCSIRSLWAGLQLLVEQALSQTTLDDLVCSSKTMTQWMNLHVDALSTLQAQPISGEDVTGLTVLPVSHEKE